MKIGGFQKLTLIDYPDKIASTIFTIGCNFRCPFCYNKILNNAKEISQNEVISYLEQRKKFIDAVVICGGEPTIHQDLPEFCAKLRQLNLLIKIDTNGAKPEMLQELVNKGLVDYIAMDIKTSFSNDRHRYNEASGSKADIEKIKQSIDIIKNLKNYEFRTTCVPEIVTAEDLIDIAQYLKENNANKAFYLQQFQAKNTLNKEFEKIKPYSEQRLLKFKEKLKPFFDKVEIRG